MSRLEFLLDIAWPGLRVSVTSITEGWAAMSMAGPKSARSNFHVSKRGVTRLGLLEGRYGDKPLRIIRLSFSGERGYEIYTGASVGKEMPRRRALRSLLPIP
ncbi:hypothetical protein EN833_21115 [Mesorhizobium sp. M4B.F.Ca.ET.190.01.1.1]|uniref:hypothetical protein n=1 Tax=unclassified Mesorhizobium TaxID=325217 RepID=UPI000A07D324|nr:MULTISPECIES: hypothetical protein [Mesorhizobium]RUW86383.1 hypothetical protein EOA29_00090 [Mesorhizobium sp. M1E.F.Ca.ET.063.01.1.1]RWF44899.1 MAG: hypothetical protein EOS65_00860 [Mesorhizobium sp.]TGR05644.1 hypothetical protein EN843_21105 [Mesorhizobium sp. M4B.F.Ca.ET.200.01.1.1]TGS16276.1 hypothetical protein EN833_21115 [Mesorhizobium sp. M4B.F.Ca.ET.190.01.1.1]TGT28477.1 hypothetical protein EN815_21090 [Mesorhizobium sp. M4B.F.Ca.ET.172.01.1.1]